MKASHEIVSFNQYRNILLHDNNKFEEYTDHWHTSVEIISPTENDYEVICNGISYTLKVGDIMLIAPGIIHSIPAKNGRRYILLADMSYLTSQRFESIISLIAPVLVITPESHPDIHQRCLELINCCAEEYFGNNSFKELAISKNLIEIFVLVARSITSSPIDNENDTKQQELNKRFMMLCEYISRHCTENLTVDSGAEMIGFSKYHFSRQFHNYAGVSFYRYVSECRIAYASILLSNPELSITDVSISSGFNSIAAFIRLFKDIKKCTPTEFRKMLSKTNK